jgi:hypothetical protein
LDRANNVKISSLPVGPRAHREHLPLIIANSLRLTGKNHMARATRFWSGTALIFSPWSIIEEHCGHDCVEQREFAGAV